MSKAVLVMDMPESCDMCDFVDNNQPPIYGVEKMYRGFPGIGEDVSDCIACRPDFCPLRHMPEKKKLKGGVHDVQSMAEEVAAANWNACIDAIGGGDGDYDGE